MLFRFIATVTSAAFIAQGALAALTPDQVVTNIGIVTTISQKASDALSPITYTSSPIVIEMAAKTLTSNLQTITTSLGGDTTAMQATPPFSDGDAQSVAVALTDFVGMHQALLAVVIGKQPVFANFAAAQPISSVLKDLQSAMDSFSLAMINLIPTRKPDVTNDKNQLDTSVQNAITDYDQLCVPLFSLGQMLPLPPICGSP